MSRGIVRKILKVESCWLYEAAVRMLSNDSQTESTEILEAAKNGTGLATECHRNRLQ